MDAAEFDRFADEYRSLHLANVAVTGEAPEYFAEYKVKALHAIAAEQGMQARHILFFPRVLAALRAMERRLSRVPFGALGAQSGISHQKSSRHGLLARRDVMLDPS